MSEALTATLTSYYDQVPYDSHPFPQTAVEHLEALSFLFGLDARRPASRACSSWAVLRVAT
ncbi:hypothetical protein [Variovorax sp. PAMC 28711]|uniref:hypothetical protein n=1 Tax=Variovorax sp. PAMC 28711 TaxID=1795631 RepID=UPI000A6DA2D9|nr:hypothetical protein [Variovorax sp. PAMC 28711]